MKQWTITKFMASKGKTKLACLTAYDAGMARLIDEAGIHLILVGDSVANAMLGHKTTLPVTMEQMLHHTAAVSRGVAAALIVADMPFMSYQAGDDAAVYNAGRFLKEAGADAVKLEGGSMRAGLVRRLVDNGIPVMAHIGLTPQSVMAFGGYKVQGRAPEAAQRLIDDAVALAGAGAFSIVLECVPAPLAAEITAKLAIPTIGIGAGAACDGQVLVLHDLLGLTPAGSTAKFVKRYAELGTATTNAVQNYISEVAAGSYPGGDQAYN